MAGRRLARWGALVGAVVVGSAAGEARAAPVEVAKLQLPGAPFDGIAITPDGTKLYVSLVAAKAPGKNTIAVVDTQTNTVAKVIDLGDQGADNSSPRQLYMSPDGGRLIHMTYVGNLLVIDTKTDTLVKTLPGVGKADAVFTPDSARLWSRDSKTKSLRVFNMADMSELAVLPLPSPGSSDFPLVITPDGARVVAVTSNDGTHPFPEPQAVTSFDAVGLKQIKDYGVGVGFLGNAGADARMSPDGKFVYAAGSNSTKIVKVDVAADAAVLSVDVPQFGEGLGLSRDGATLFAFENGYGSGAIRVYAAESLTLQKTVDMTGQVARFLATSAKSAFAPSGCAVIVPGALKNQIVALDPQTYASIGTFATPAGTPYTVEFLPNSTRAYVPWRDSATTGYLTILDLGPACALAGDGDPCQKNDECASGVCVDGVCCDSACGGGATDDCQACSIAEGGLVDGACGPVMAGAICRPEDGACDQAEACDGVGFECPADAPKADGEPCDGGSCMAGVCEPDPVGGSSSGGDTSGSTSDGSGGSSGGDTTSGGGTTTSGGETTTTGEAPTTSVGSASDGGSGSGEGGTTAGGTATGGATTGDSTGIDSASGSGGESSASDGCSCDGGGGNGGTAGWLLLLGLVGLRRGARGRRAPTGSH